MLSQLEEVIKHLKRKELPLILKIQTTIIKAMEDFMISKGFVQLMPIITSKITDPLGPDPGSSVVAFPKIRYYDMELVLTQSMILHKQLALLTGLEKIFIMSPNIRLENKLRKSTGKHLFEFTQMDFEIAYGSMKEVMSLTEDLVCEIISRVLRENGEELELLGRKLEVPPRPFKVYTTHELEEKYGKDWEALASLDHKYPFWAVCFKREFYDREDPEKPGHYRNYDLIYPEGFGEGLSGGEREWQYDRIISRIRRDGLDLSRFKEYLYVARRGLLLPSAGAGIGVERLVRFITGAKHVGDVQPFRRVPGEPVYL
ncbi:MAG: asparagine synthetase [Thermofilum sp. ex4484_82]|nr:MAG: asparagine synthetase [Thermofilum sp. ex4484_82]OYT38537.1 MAG: asparagine synthetase [Archaeoglobales archaeon ex4484_92]